MITVPPQIRRPQKATISKSVSTNVATGVTTNQYTITFLTTITGQEVAAE